MKTLLSIALCLLTSQAFSQGWLGNSPTSMIAQEATGSTTNIRVGIGVGLPATTLHTRGTLRFEALQLSNNSRVLVTDNLGNVSYRDASSIAPPAWLLNGNALTTGNEFLGTLNNFPLRLFTNGTQKGVLTTGGSLGLGTLNPTHSLEVINAAGGSFLLGNPGLNQSSSLRMIGSRTWGGAATGSIQFGGYAFLQATPSSFVPDALWTAAGAIANPNGAIRVCQSGSDTNPISSFEISSARTLANGGLGVNLPLNSILNGILEVNCDPSIANNGGLVRLNNVPQGAGNMMVIDGNGYVRQTPVPVNNNNNGWLLTGNNLTTGTEFLGTLTNDPLRLVTNGTQKGVLTTGGALGLGTTTPSHSLEVSGNAVSFLLGNSGLTQSSSIRMIGNRLWSAAPNPGIAFGGYSFIQATPNNFVPSAAWTAAGAIANPNGAIRVCQSSSDGQQISSFEVSSSRTLMNGGLGVNLPLNTLLTGVLDVSCNAGLPNNTGLVRFQNVPNGTGQALVIDANGYIRQSAAAGGGGATYTAGTGISITPTNQINSVWTENGTNIYNNNTANVGIGLTNPTAKFQVSSTTNQVASQTENSIATTNFGSSPIAVSGKADASVGIGYGGTFDGGNTGVYAEAESNLDQLQPSQLGSSIFDLKGVEAFSNDNGLTNPRWSIGMKSQAFTSSSNGLAVGTYAFGQNTANSTNEWALYADGRTFTPGGVWTSSDARLKTKIADVDNAIDIVNQLSAKSYEFRKDGKFAGAQLPEGKNFGFLAQDLEKVIPEAVTEVPLVFHGQDKKQVSTENYKAVNYTTLVPILAEAIKEQQAIITKQATQIEEIQQLLHKQTEVSKMVEVSNQFDGASLSQNVPNPFTTNTVITFTLPKAYKNAKIGVYDLNGHELKLFTLNNSSNSITIEAGNLQAGMYLYSLIIDGVSVDTKKMTLTSN